MRTKVKSVNHQSVLPGLFIILIFFGLGVLILVPIINTIIAEGLLMGILYSFIAIIFDAAFLGFSMYGITKLIGPRTRYQAVLTHKDKIIHNDKEYLVLDFLVDEGDDKIIQNGFKAYCPKTEDNDFTINEKYIIGIQEANWEIKYVELFDETKKVKKKMPSMTMRPIFYTVSAIFYFSFIGAIIMGIISLKDSIFMGLVLIIYGVASTILLSKYLTKAFKIFKH